jgi:hypothetical protein
MREPDRHDLKDRKPAAAAIFSFESDYSPWEQANIGLSFGASSHFELWYELQRDADAGSHHSR